MSVPAARATAAMALGAKLVQARQATAVDVSKLTAQRGESIGEGSQRVDGRVMDLIVRELSEALLHPEPRPRAKTEPEFLAIAGPTSPPSPGDASTPERRAESVIELIDRIDVMMKSQRPKLALTLNNAFAARVEVEKVGPGQVALTIQGWNGPPSVGELARIRESIRQRGLQLISLSIG
jgi:hypothetical protein